MVGTLTSQARRDLLVRLLEQAGYPAECQAEGFPVWLGGRTIERVDVVAFGRASPLYMTTATIVCDLSGANAPLEPALQAAAALAAPMVVTVTDDAIQLYSATRPDGGPISSSGVDELASVIPLLQPGKLLAAKVGHRQLPLFPERADYLGAARRDGALRLEPLLVAAFATATEHYESFVEAEQAHREAARLVIGSLTTLVLRDKNDLRALSHDELLATVAARFPRNFEWIDGLRVQDRRLLQALLTELGDWIDYTSLDPSIMSEVYESALVADEERASLGIHYTPPGLARRLLSSLPVEVIHPEERFVLDPACGSGTLLVAAHDRLSNLQPDDWSMDRRHEDLRIHLRGTDRDPFAAEIARLALLLNAMPSGNGWKIDTGNSLDDLGSPEPAPSIVVANPPWRHSRVDGTSLETADAFVELSVRILRPGGLLALLLPSSWLDSRASRAARSDLLQSCEMFETWRLPLGAFPTSNTRSVAILARKRFGDSYEDGARVIRYIRPGRVDDFTQSGHADDTYLVVDPDKGRDRSPLANVLPVEGVTLGDVADIRSGTQPKRGISDGSGETLYLPTLRNIRPMAVLSTQPLWSVRFPEDFQSSRGAELVGRRKVLVSAMRRSDGPWCVKNVVDLHGVAVRNSVHMIAPKVDSSQMLDSIFALTASAFYNCWIDDHAVGVNIPTSATRSCPLPHGEFFARRLAPWGRRLRELHEGVSPEERASVLREIDDRVFSGFNAGDELRRICLRRVAGEVGPEGFARYLADSAGPHEGSSTPDGLRRFGYVMDVADNRLRVWVSGLTDDEGEWIGLPSRLPGYLARPGAGFDVVGHSAGLEHGEFRLQQRSWDEFGLPPTVASSELQT